MREQLVFSGIAVLSVVVGLPLARRRIPRNRWYGLRIPATFADDHVWYEANAVTGRDLIVLGGVLLLASLGLPPLGITSPAMYGAACAGIFGAGSIICTVRGWRLANRLWRERRPGGAGQLPRAEPPRL
jgi:hypothetical protein